jgi:tRNA A37 methylthiotransferase MiaB
VGCVVWKVVLLGQNVNSYMLRAGGEGTEYEAAPGFSNMYKKRDGMALRFADLLDAVSLVDPDMRIRYARPRGRAGHMGR